MKSKHVKPISALIKLTLISVSKRDKIFQIGYLRAKLFGGDIMAFSYNKLWKILIDRKMMKKDLMAMTGLTTTTMAKLGKELPVSMDVLARICKALRCNIGDIVDYIDEENK
ncbi:MAG TPA: helix-turn-helix transcriptional regulator [Paludibacter sp.]|jgi:DNA-binding Xre family transcriptional regulator|nr:helix-turn-helix transcriptional regulator [Paludibacter sp.]